MKSNQVFTLFKGLKDHLVELLLLLVHDFSINKSIIVPSCSNGNFSHIQNELKLLSSIRVSFSKTLQKEK